MALPTPVKTWQYSVNQAAGLKGSIELSCDDVWLQIKNTLIGFASNPWVVWGSCDGAGNFSTTEDGQDYWQNDPANLRHAQAGSPHSWMVLKNTANGMQVCLDIVHGGSTAYNMGSIVVSWVGFATAGGTAGSNTNRPTAVDEVVFVSAAACFPNANVGYMNHYLHSTDGEETRIIICYNSLICQFWLFGMPQAPTTGWTLGMSAVKVNAGTINQASYALFNDAAAIRTKIGGDNISLYLSSEMMGTAMLGQTQTYPDDDTGCWPMCSMGLVNTVGTTGGEKVCWSTCGGAPRAWRPGRRSQPMPAVPLRSSAT